MTLPWRMPLTSGTHVLHLLRPAHHAGLHARADTFDAYVATNGTVKLVDFNPVGGTTSPLLFTWAQLGLQAEAERFEAHPAGSQQLLPVLIPAATAAAGAGPAEGGGASCR